MPPAGSELTAGSSSSGGSDTAIIKPLQIYRLIKPVLRQAAARSLCLPGALPGLEPAKCSSSGSGSGRQLDAELPFYSKHLLIAAFLASYNPPSRDVATFSLTSTGVMKKRRRGGSQGPATAKAKLAKGGAGVATKASANTLLQAPQPFGLERLLAIFYTLGTQLY
jgi:origin recognition complex subunit 5